MVASNRTIGAALIGLVLMAAAVLPLRAQAAPAPAAGPAAASATAPTQADGEKERDQKRLDTIRYGIESEITDLLKTLDSEKEGKFNDDILALFRSARNAKLRIAILDFFTGQEWKGAEQDAVDIVAARDRNDGALVTQALTYLAQIRSKAALGYAQAIIKEDNKKLLPGLIRLIGRAGSATEEDLLLAWMDSDSATDDLKQAAIRALGELGSSKAVERLRKIAEDELQGKATRMAACDALGKIADAGSIPSLVKAANGEDPNVRATAVSALASFKAAEATAAIMDALRDSAVMVRLAACKACARLALAQAVPAIVYKASNDPEKAVRTEAFRSLADIGGGEAFGFLKGFVGDKAGDQAMKALVFGLLLRKDPSSIPLLQARLLAEAKEKDRALYTAFARELSNATDAPGGAPLARVLLADPDYLIRVAALEWARKNKAQDFRGDLEQLVVKDPSDYIRKRAADVLSSLKG
jgi:HEAT repeat protein